MVIAGWKNLWVAIDSGLYMLKRFGGLEGREKCNLEKVQNEEGEVVTGEAAVKVWKQYF